MIPPLRVVWPAWYESAGTPDAPLCVEFAATTADELRLATSALGLGFVTHGRTVAVRAPHSRLHALALELRRRESSLADLLEEALHPLPSWRLRTKTLDLANPVVMGILNLTADSFSGDGVGRDAERAIREAAAQRDAGADLIDVGAETARADRPALEAEPEAELIGAVVRRLVVEGHDVSADTYKPLVARAALDAGAEVVNDISGLTAGTGAAEVARDAGAGYVLNYSFSIPKRRPDSPPVYQDVVAETVAWMFERAGHLRSIGLDRSRIAIDPGIAFGKSHDEDIQVLRRLGELRSLGLPLLLAHSRKNFIGSITGLPPGERDPETHAATVLAFAQGARIFRVHDVAGTRRSLSIAAALVTGSPGDWKPGPESWPWAAGSSAPHMTAAPPHEAAPAGQRW